RSPAMESSAADASEMPAGKPETADLSALLRASAEGSSTALGQPFMQCWPYLLAKAYLAIPTSLRSKADPQDLVQDAFLSALEVHSEFRGKTGEEFQAWMDQFLHHDSLDFVRRYRRKKRDARRESSADQSAGVRQALESVSSRSAGD